MLLQTHHSGMLFSSRRTLLYLIPTQSTTPQLQIAQDPWQQQELASKHRQILSCISTFLLHCQHCPVTKGACKRTQRISTASVLAVLSAAMESRLTVAKLWALRRALDVDVILRLASDVHKDCHVPGGSENWVGCHNFICKCWHRYFSCSSSP